MTTIDSPPRARPVPQGLQILVAIGAIMCGWLVATSCCVGEADPPDFVERPPGTVEFWPCDGDLPPVVFPDGFLMGSGLATWDGETLVLEYETEANPSRYAATYRVVGDSRRD